MEIWLPITGFKGAYEVSNLGRVRSLPRVVSNGAQRTRYTSTHLLTPVPVRGYLTVTLCYPGHSPRLQKSAKVHRLVAYAFLGPAPYPNAQVNHRDGDKTNNAVGNLEWTTASENELHAVRLGLAALGERHGRSVLSEESVRAIRLRAARGESRRTLADEFGVGLTTIRQVVVGLTWRASLELARGA